MDSPDVERRTTNLKCDAKIAAAVNDEAAPTLFDAPNANSNPAVPAHPGATHDALHGVRAAKRCAVNWNDMVGDDGVRTCKTCNLTVFRSAEVAVAQLSRTGDTTSPHSSGTSETLYRRSDGTYTFGDCCSIRLHSEAFLANWKRIMFRPKEFYANLPADVGATRAVTFYLVLSAIDVFFYFLVLSMSASLARSNEGSLVGSLAYPLLLLMAAIVGSTMWTFFNLLGSGLIFFVARIFGGKGNYEGTYRVNAYSSAPIMFRWIPIVNVIATGYSVYLLSLGLKRTHQLSAWQTAVVVTIVGTCWLLTMVFVGVLAAEFLLSGGHVL